MSHNSAPEEICLALESLYDDLRHLAHKHHVGFFVQGGDVSPSYIAEEWREGRDVEVKISISANTHKKGVH